MCIICNRNKTDEEVKSQYEELLKYNYFPFFNNITISHLLLSYIGVNGEQAEKLSYQILNSYITWYNSNGTHFENLPHPDYIQTSIQSSLDLKNKLHSKGYTTREQIINKLLKSYHNS